MTSENTNKKLLIVDDSKVSRMVIRAHVKAVHPEWEILEASNGADAIKVSAQDLPDYCTMDINMPGMLGTDAAEQILLQHPQMRVVIFSANIQESFQTRSNALGAVFVAKPVTEKSISHALEHFKGAE
ncbi:response regulator [Undibacterium sp.]|jgi:two-component system chemotaxis response regulator CheY|uniref:response regulator n=1 Tax=Undibacterium sp. TaxID=1914977 RepID=UPI002C26E232|nr:response regulator [Undibacterium sp.]HTD03074.1 response regulator [Undibacterium sp.]